MNHKLSVIIGLTLGIFGCVAESDDIGSDESWSEVEATDEAEQFRIGECICTDGISFPVCGRNGVTYASACFASCAGVEVAFIGECGTGVPETRPSIDPAKCITLAGLNPLPSEDGHLSAVRLPIEDDPFKVESITYSLVDSAGIPGCDASVPQQISVWVQDNSFPDASPKLLYSTLFVPVPTPGAPNSFFDVELPQPIVLGVGESLFVSFSMDYVDESSRSCVLSCNPLGPEEPPTTGERGFWSNSASPPYPWSDLADFGISSIPLIFANGQRLTKGIGVSI